MYNRTSSICTNRPCQGASSATASSSSSTIPWLQNIFSRTAPFALCAITTLHSANTLALLLDCTNTPRYASLRDSIFSWNYSTFQRTWPQCSQRNASVLRMNRPGQTIQWVHYGNGQRQLHHSSSTTNSTTTSYDCHTVFKKDAPSITSPPSTCFFAKRRI